MSTARLRALALLSSRTIERQMRSHHRQTNAAARAKRRQLVQMSRRPRAKPQSSFPCFNPPLEAIRLVVIMYLRFPLSLRSVDDFLFERGIELSHETLCFSRNHFGLMWSAAFAGCGWPQVRLLLLAPQRDLREDQRRDVFPLARRQPRGRRAGILRHQEREQGNSTRCKMKPLARQGSPETVTTDELRLSRAALTVGNAAK